MKIWVSKNSEVSIVDQLVEQISLGIASHDLKVGEKLPSTRELARRFGIHQNTVIAAYRRLAETGLVEFKKGSGVYVAVAKRPYVASNGLGSIVDRFVSESAAAGYSLADMIEHLRSRVDANPRKFLLVESDVELRKILLTEIEAATNATIEGISLEDFSASLADSEAHVTAFTQRRKIRKLCAPGKCIALRPNSVPASLSRHSRPSDHDLIAIVSDWDKFRKMAKLFLIAASIDPDTIVIRTPRFSDWKSGLDHASLIICDSLTASHFPDDDRARVFPLIAESSLSELRSISGTRLSHL